MPKIKYKEIRIRESGLALIEQVNSVVNDYDEQGYSLTLRQLYYQLVSENVIENSLKSYNNLGVLLNNGRLAGYVDWNAIEDRTRFIRALQHWSSPKARLISAASSHNIDLWQEQECYVEVWVEKDALIEIVETTADNFDVPCFSCRGYVSQSEMWEASLRFIDKTDEGKKCILLHLGDHDPSGIDMSRDIQERLNMFYADVKLQRIALNMPQIEQYNPPPNPAKITDSRAKDYIKKHGTSSCELDALPPRVLTELINEHILKYLDMDLFKEAQKRQEQERDLIRAVNI